MVAPQAPLSTDVRSASSAQRLRGPGRPGRRDVRSRQALGHQGPRTGMGGSEVRVERRAHELLRRARRPLRHGEVVVDEPGGPVGEPRDGQDVVGEADGLGLPGADAFAADGQPHGPTQADEPRQPPGRHPGREPLGGGGQPQHGVLGEDPDVAGQRELEAAAEAVPVDLGDDQAIQPFQPDERLLLQRVEAVGHALGGEHVQVEARAERPTLAAHHDDPRLVALHSGDGVDEPGHPRHVHRVELPGPRQHDLGDLAHPADLHCLHAQTVSRRRRHTQAVDLGVPALVLRPGRAARARRSCPG